MSEDFTHPLSGGETDLGQDYFFDLNDRVVGFIPSNVPGQNAIWFLAGEDVALLNTETARTIGQRMIAWADQAEGEA